MLRENVSLSSCNQFLIGSKTTQLYLKDIFFCISWEKEDSAKSIRYCFAFEWHAYNDNIGYWMFALGYAQFWKRFITFQVLDVL
jgi:hypothetical protein